MGQERFSDTWSKARLKAALNLNDKDREAVMRFGCEAARLLNLDTIESADLVAKVGITLTGRLGEYKAIRKQETTKY
jgi:hypothetical protein